MIQEVKDKLQAQIDALSLVEEGVNRAQGKANSASGVLLESLPEILHKDLGAVKETVAEVKSAIAELIVEVSNIPIQEGE